MTLQISVNHYSPVTGESTATEHVEHDPSSGPIPLLSFSTTDELPITGPNEKACYLDDQGLPAKAVNGGTWHVKADFRGTVYWLADGTRKVVDALGLVVPEGASTTAPPPAPPTEAALEAAAGAAVKAMLDGLAISWQYTSYESARTYKGDITPKFNAEGTALANYGSACYATLDQIASGAIERPADESALLALLPDPPTRPTPPWS